jgi:chromosome partitioning protein
MVTSIASQKGGTGKTSTTISLSAGLAHKGKKVLLIDIDSHANSSKVLIRDYQKLAKAQTIYTTIIERRPLPIHTTHVTNLSIDKIKDQYDFIFIDKPPALGWLTLNSFTASDNVLVLVSPGYFELDSLAQLSKTLEEVREYFNPNLNLLGYLFTLDICSQ